MTMQNDSAAKFLHQRQITNKLQRIPEPCSACKRSSCPPGVNRPNRLRRPAQMTAYSSPFGALPAPFVFPPPLAQISTHQQQQPPRPMRRADSGSFPASGESIPPPCPVRLDREKPILNCRVPVAGGVHLKGPAITGNRFFQATFILQCVAQIRMSFRILRIKRQSPLKARNRFRRPTIVAKGNPQVVMNDGQFGRQFECPTITLNRSLIPVLFPPNISQVVVSRDMPRIQTQSLLISRLGLTEISRILQPCRGCNVCRRCPDSRANA